MELGRIHKRKLCNPNGHLETVTIVNGEGNEATQSSYGFVSFLSTYGPGMKKLPEICKWTPQLIDIVQPPLKRLINPMNGDNETQSHTPVIEYDNLNIPNSSSCDDSISL